MKQYFNKIKNAENPVGKRENLSVDKDAAARMIKAGLVSWRSVPMTDMAVANIATSRATINTIYRRPSNKQRNERRPTLSSNRYLRR